MEQLNNNDEEAGKETTNEDSAKEEIIEMPKSQYEAILTRFEELEERLASSKNIDSDDIDNLAKEGRKALSANATPQMKKSLEDMSNSELAEFILGEMTQYSQPMLVAIETQKVQREIDKCERDYADFGDYRKVTQKIAIDNPTLSIEEAYKLAKGKVDSAKPKVKGSEDESGERRSTSAKILSLKKPLGEKPGMSPGASKGSGVMTLQEAARLAAREAGLT